MTAFISQVMPQRRARFSQVVKRGLMLALMAVIILMLAVSGADAATKKKKKSAAKPPDRYASIVIEAETGYVLSEKNADKSLHPASLTKIMTLYMTFEAIQNGRLTKNTRIPVSKHAAFQEPSELGLAAGSTIRVEDAIYGLVTKSANDASVVLAEAIGGSESGFARMMTTRARQLGMKNTTYKNASGLHNKGQVSTARDQAILGQAIMRDFPRDYRYFSTKTFKYAGRTYANHNKLMNTYIGMDGIKTGFVNASGFNLVASAKRNGTRLIGVVFGGQTSKSRNDHMAQLLDLGFDRISDVRVATAISQRQQNPATTKALSATSTAALKAAGSQPVQTAQQLPVRPPLPRFDAMGLVTEQGDREDTTTPAYSPDQPVKPVVTGSSATATTLTAAELKARNAQAAPTQTASAVLPAGELRGAGEWAIQVGAFSSHNAGMTALKAAHQKLPVTITNRAEYVIVPLMTNRGVIYRARLTGLEHSEATAACAQLRDTCLVLTAN